jgi:hypothetical protein
MTLDLVSLSRPSHWPLNYNVGMKIRIFRKKEDAIAWLKKVG